MLIREYGIHISQGRVYRLMKGMTLPKMSTSKPVNKTQKNPDASEKSNILKQDFSQSAPNKVWVSDFTYIKAGNRWFYLCVVIDLFSRKVIGWQLSSKPDADLVISAFKKAWSERNCPEGLMFHSDQGAQYTSKAFRRLLDSCGVLQSFSKKGYPYDNAVCESFFKYLKKELTNRESYADEKELRLALFEYIESYYNNRRPHGSIGMQTPNQAEENYSSNFSL